MTPGSEPITSFSHHIDSGLVERFCHYVARGESASAAYKITHPLAGKRTCATNGSAMSQRKDVKLRIAYLKKFTEDIIHDLTEPNHEEAKAQDRTRRVTEDQSLKEEVKSKVVDLLNKKAEGKFDSTEMLVGTVMSTLEKRIFLANIVRTPIGRVDAENPIVQASEFEVRMSGSGDQREARQILKIRMPDKIRAIELDCRIAGDLEPNKDSGGDLRSLQQFIINMVNDPNPPGSKMITLDI